MPVLRATTPTQVPPQITCYMGTNSPPIQTSFSFAGYSLFAIGGYGIVNCDSVVIGLFLSVCVQQNVAGAWVNMVCNLDVRVFVTGDLVSVAYPCPPRSYGEYRLYAIAGVIAPTSYIPPVGTAEYTSLSSFFPC